MLWYGYAATSMLYLNSGNYYLRGLFSTILDARTLDLCVIAEARSPGRLPRFNKTAG